MHSQSDSMADESGKLIVLITGTSAGLGLATAVLLAKDPARRFRVYATMRNMDDKRGPLETAAGGDEGGILGQTLFIRELDVSRDGDQHNVVDSIVEEEGRIDVLVNNAGVMLWDVVDNVQLEQAQGLMDINFWGMVRMMRAVMPSMKAKKAGRIINISSIFGFDSPPFQSFYAASKFAVEGLTESLAPVLRLYNIWAILIEPALVTTNMTQSLENPAAFVSDTPKDAGFDDVTTAAFHHRLASPDIKQLIGSIQAPDQVANVIRDAIVSEEPHLRYQTGEMSEALAAMRMVDLQGDSRYDMLIQKD